MKRSPKFLMYLSLNSYTLANKRIKDQIILVSVHKWYWYVSSSTHTPNKTNDNKVIPEPIDDRKFQE